MKMRAWRLFFRAAFTLAAGYLRCQHFPSFASAAAFAHCVIRQITEP